MNQNGDAAITFDENGKESRYNSFYDDTKSARLLHRQRRRHVRPRSVKGHRRRSNISSLFTNGGLPFIVFLTFLIGLQLYLFANHFQSSSSDTPSSLWKHVSNNRTNLALRKVKDFVSHRIIPGRKGNHHAPKQNLHPPQQGDPNRIHPKQKQDEIQQPPPKRPLGGVVILGMHRSGTSMLTGLLVEGFGFHVGQPLIEAAFDNEKGFYELLPVVLQNDAFMSDQGIDWSYNVIYYNLNKLLKKVMQVMKCILLTAVNSQYTRRMRKE
jgi:hypothetical protein